MKIVQLNRRDFLKYSALMGSGLTLGLSGFTKLATADTGSALPPYLRIAPDGSIYLGVPSSEMGQGSHTGQRPEVYRRRIARRLRQARAHNPGNGSAWLAFDVDGGAPFPTPPVNMKSGLL